MKNKKDVMNTLSRRTINVNCVLEERIYYVYLLGLELKSYPSNDRKVTKEII